MKPNLYKKKYDLKDLCFFIMLLMTAVFPSGCSSDDIKPEATEEEGDTAVAELVVDTGKIYIPQALRNNDFYNSESTWYYGRSRQSDHFIVFWGKGYGNNDPASSGVPDTYRVDIDDLLEKAEEFYTLNVEELKFAVTGAGTSRLDSYKMMIFLYYQTDWLATGSGYDNMIGALWVSPSTCKPVGATIGHEIGHSFQYQVYCDLGGSSGFRYGFGGNGGNAFWEQTAQWQAYQSYPNEAFTSYHFGVYTQNYHRHVHHESYRYASYFIHYYWANKHGRDIIGKIWRQAQQPEDPIQAYMRITGITVDQLNAEIYDAATKFVTWDLDALRTIGANYIGAQTFNYTRLSDGSYQVSYDRCPGTTGYNVIPLNVPVAGTQVSATFTGQVNASGFNQVANPARAGWRYGYVALLKDGTRVYGNMNSGSGGTASFTVPSNCSKLWFVVTGAPNSYAAHPWDENESNDDQWPYKVKFTNTDIHGNITFDGTETPQNITFTYDVSFPFSATTYPGKTVNLEDDIINLARAFVLQPGAITAAMGGSIRFYAVESSGALNATTTANGYGHWFNANGNVCPWGSLARVYSEYDATNFAFAIGQYPGQSQPGSQYTIKQAMVYEYETGHTVQATFVFNVTIQ